jgi:DHA2 family multidrug resistance protein
MTLAAVPGSTTGYKGITVAAFLATYMQSINISVPNAALPHMQGTLSMANDEIGWIFTAYIAASLIVIPLTPWLVGRFGRNRVYLTSLALFALGLILNTLAETSTQFVLARILQGLAGGPLAPVSLAILLDIFSPAREARINLLWSITILFGISTGPGIGGWLSEYYGWHSIFYLSLPAVAFIALAAILSLSEKKPARPPQFDFFGFAMFSVGMTALQMLLDRGERLEWFNSKEIWIEAIAAATGFYLFFVNILTSEAHFFDKALFKDRNFALSTIMYFASGFVLLPTLALTSPMLEELLGYPVDTTGYITIWRGITLVGALALMGVAPTRIDIRVYMMVGMALVVYANYRMLGYSPLMDWRPVAVSNLLQGGGLGMLMSALAKSAFWTLPPQFKPQANGIFVLSRLYGATTGVAVVQVYFFNNTQIVHASLGEHITPYQATGGTASTSTETLEALNQLVTHQAAVIAIIDQFKILMVVMLIVSPLVLFLRKPRANSPSPSMASR